MKTNKPAQPIKLTPSLLRSLIEEEVKGFGDMEDVEDRANDAKETDADEFADTLDKHIDYMKALKIEESRLTKRLAKVRKALTEGAKKLVVSKVV
jgi:uncharacterized protein YdaT